MLTVVLTLLAAATDATSSVLQRQAHRQVHRSAAVHHEVHHVALPLARDRAPRPAPRKPGWRTMLGALRRPVWLAGIALLPISSVLGAFALDTGEVSLVQSLMCLELPMALVLSSIAFGHRMRPVDWAAIAAMAVGMGVFLVALSPTGGHPGRVPDGQWLIGGGGTALVVVVLGLAGWRAGTHQPGRRGLLLGTGSGMSFALSAVFTSAALAHGFTWGVFGMWQTYLIPVTAGAAMLLMQWGMHGGTLVAVQPGVTLADPVVAIAIGVAMFHEHVRTGAWIALEAVAAVAVVAGTVLISRSEAAAAETEVDEPVAVPQPAAA